MYKSSYLCVLSDLVKSSTIARARISARFSWCQTIQILIDRTLRGALHPVTAPLRALGTLVVNHAITRSSQPWRRRATKLLIGAVAVATAISMLDQTPLASAQDASAQDAAPQAPYLTWRATDTSGNLVPGATFRIGGPRTTSSWGVTSWGVSALVEDNVGQPGYSGLDLDPTPGQFAVTHVGSTRIENDRRYRVQRVEAPAGYVLGSTSWVQMPGSGNNGSWSPGSGVHQFSDFAFQQTTRHTIVVSKSDLRTGLGQNAHQGTYTVGARFALYSSQTSTNALATCEISNAAQGCRFTNVPGGASYWVGEIDPAPGTPAATNYTVPITTLTAGDNDRPYRYQTATLPTAGNSQTIQMPSGHATSGTWSDSSGVFANRLQNPDLEIACEAPIRVALVMDLSNSIGTPTDYRNSLRDSAMGLVDALRPSDAGVALYSFGTAAPRAGTSNYPVPVGADSGYGTLQSRINAYRNSIATNTTDGGGGTNWDAGLYAVSQQIAAQQYDVVLVLTDGNPTFSLTNNNGGGGAHTNFAEIERAVLAANAIKQGGARVLAVGVGGSLSTHNLAAISGTQPAGQGITLNEADYTTAGWGELAALLSDFAQGITCQAGVNVSKRVLDSSGNEQPSAGWEFTVSSSSGTVSPSASQLTTSPDGNASWGIQFSQPDETGTVTIVESPRSDWTVQSVTCTVNGASRPVTVGATVTISDVGIGDQVNCVFTNAQASTLTLVKELNTQYDLEASPDQWQLTAAGAATTVEGLSGTDAVTSVAVQPGQYTLSESLLPAYAAKGPGYELESLVCEDSATGGDVSIDGDQRINIAVGADVVCTFTNRDLPGSVSWGKIAAETEVLLSGSEWLLTGPGIDPEGLVIEDFEGTPPNADGPDQDGAGGTFLIEELAWGNYTLVETRAPAGYQLSTDEIPFEIGPESGSESLNIVLERIENRKQDALAIPLTGGIGTHLFIIIGAVLMALALGAVIWQRRKARVLTE